MLEHGTGPVLGSRAFTFTLPSAAQVTRARSLPFPPLTVRMWPVTVAVTFAWATGQASSMAMGTRSFAVSGRRWIGALRGQWDGVAGGAMMEHRRLPEVSPLGRSRGARLGEPLRLPIDPGEQEPDEPRRHKAD